MCQPYIESATALSDDGEEIASSSFDGQLKFTSTFLLEVAKDSKRGVL